MAPPDNLLSPLPLPAQHRLWDYFFIHLLICEIQNFNIKEDIL